MIEKMGDFRALDPFFRIIEQGLAGFVDGDHFFDLLAQDVVFDFIITVPNYPRHVVGRATSSNSTEATAPRSSSTAATTCASISRRQRRRWCSNIPPRDGSWPPGSPTATDTSPLSSSRTAKSPHGATTWIPCGSSPPSRDAPSNRTPSPRPIHETADRHTSERAAPKLGERHVVSDRIEQRENHQAEPSRDR